MTSEKGIIFFNNPDGNSVIISFNQHADIISIKKYSIDNREAFFEYIRSRPNYGEYGVTEHQMLMGLIKSFIDNVDQLIEIASGFESGRFLDLEREWDDNDGSRLFSIN